MKKLFSKIKPKKTRNPRPASDVDNSNPDVKEKKIQMEALRKIRLEYRASNANHDFFKISKDVIRYLGENFLTKRELINFSNSSSRLREIFSDKKLFLDLVNPCLDNDYTSCKSYFNIVQTFGKKSYISDVTQLRDGRLVIGYSNGVIEILRIVDNDPEKNGYKEKVSSEHRADCMQTLKIHKDKITHLRQVSETHLISLDKKNNVVLWRVNKSELVHISKFKFKQLSNSQYAITPVCFCLLGGGHLAVSFEGKILIKEAKLGGKLYTCAIDSHECLILCMQNTVDNKLLIMTVYDYPKVKVSQYSIDQENEFRLVEEPEHSRITEIPYKMDTMNFLNFATFDQFGKFTLFYKFESKRKFGIYQESKENVFEDNASSENKHFFTSCDLVHNGMTASGGMLFWANNTWVGGEFDNSTELRLVNFDLRK